MTLDMMFANFQAGNAKADDKQDLDSKADAKQDFADRMKTVQESTVNAAWASFRKTLEGLKDDTPAENVEKAFKQCCDSAIATTLFAAVLMV